MNAKPSVQVRITRRFAASAEQVFDAWLDADKVGRWLFAMSLGEMARVEIDAKVGGSFTFVDRSNGKKVEHTGRYLEIDRPQLLVFTLSKDSSDSGRVIVEIVPLEGGCELTLTHVGVPPDYVNRIETGWNRILEALAGTLGEDAGCAVGATVEGSEESQ
ncbi:MAG: SRPBCC domain-containing protein [candidate division Zixibacteria bacterium]|nr:SRPBCC domain-containing protein [candidate division Zixibacteria bacterium]